MPDNVTAPLHRMLAEGMTMDDAIRELRRIGFDEELAAVALVRVTALTPAEALRRIRRITNATEG